MAITLDGTSGITTPAIASTGSSTFTGSLALPSGGLTVGTDQLAVDSSGRVTMPYQPHARATRNTGFIAGNTVIVFNYADENSAGMYNTSTGRFTAPVTGRYLFAHGMFSENGYPAWVAWRVNGVNIATTYTNATDYNSVAGSIVLSMSAADYADLYVNGSPYRVYGGDRIQCWATFTFLG